MGVRLTDWLDLVPLHPAYRARFTDGSTLDAQSDVEAVVAEIDRVCRPDDAAGYRRFVDFAWRHARLGGRHQARDAARHGRLTRRSGS